MEVRVREGSRRRAQLSGNDTVDAARGTACPWGRDQVSRGSWRRSTSGQWAWFAHC